MAKEIEKKFLVNDMKFMDSSVKHIIKQGYICSDSNRVVRVRIKDEKAFLTVKNATIGFARDEFEYEIPMSDAEVMLDRVCIHPIICKTRYEYEYSGHIWEIDCFHGDNEGLVVAEIELDNENEKFDKPDFIDIEVTGDSKYYNALLFSNPYQNWK